MEAIISLLINYYIISVGVSAAIKGLKVLKARKIIKSNGFEITKGDLEIQEEIAEFFKDNIYILNPFKNIKKSWKLIWGSNKKYAAAYMEKLKNQGKLKKVEKQEVVRVEEPKPKKQEVKKEERKKERPERKVTPSFDRNAELITDEFRSEIEASNDIYFVTEIKKVYRQKSKDERAAYHRLQEEFNKTSDKAKKTSLANEAKNVCRRIKAYDELYMAAKVRIDELQNTSGIIRR